MKQNTCSNKRECRTVAAAVAAIQPRTPLSLRCCGLYSYYTSHTHAHTCVCVFLILVIAGIVMVHIGIWYIYICACGFRTTEDEKDDGNDDDDYSKRHNDNNSLSIHINATNGGRRNTYDKHCATTENWRFSKFSILMNL